MFKIDVLGTFQGRHYTDITLGRNFMRHFRTHCRTQFYDTLNKTDCFLSPGGTLKLYFNNVLVINFVECVKLTLLGHPQNIIMRMSPRNIFHPSFGGVSTNFMKMFTYVYISMCSPIANIGKTMIQRSIFKNMLKNDVSVTSVC